MRCYRDGLEVSIWKGNDIPTQNCGVNEVAAGVGSEK